MVAFLTIQPLTILNWGPSNWGYPLCPLHSPQPGSFQLGHVSCNSETMINVRLFRSTEGCCLGWCFQSQWTQLPPASNMPSCSIHQRRQVSLLAAQAEFSLRANQALLADFLRWYAPDSPDHKCSFGREASRGIGAVGCYEFSVTARAILLQVCL